MAKSAALQTKPERTTHLPDRIKLTPEVLTRLSDFFEFLPPTEFRNQLIEMYHLYILHEHESLPNDFARLAEGMITFLDLLQFAAQEWEENNGTGMRQA